jgi:hypothetical protein
VAGVFFTPRGTMRRLLDEGSVPMAMLWLLGSAALMLAVTAIPELVAGRSPTWGLALLEALAEVPRYLLIAALLMVAFRMMGHKPAFKGLVIASAWGAIPMIVMVLLGLLAAGPMVSTLAAEPTVPHGDSAAIITMSVVAVLLVLGGIAWWFVAGLAGLAEAARSSRGIAFAALLITMATLFCVVFLIAIAYVLATGQVPGLS